MRRLVYLSSAQEDLGNILRYITRESVSLETGSKFVDKLKQRCAHLASLPGMLGTARPELLDGLRSMPSQGYVIFFRYGSGTLEVVNILHASRDVSRLYDEA